MAGILVTGAGGQLGAYVMAELARAGVPVTGWTGSRSGERSGIPLRTVDVGDADRVRAAFAEAAPDAVLHAAASARVADCHRDPAGAERVNVAGTRHLAQACAASGARLVMVSTDLVFDGTRAPYAEGAAPTPVSVYGRTKARAEEIALAVPGAVVARVSLLVGPSRCGVRSFFDEQVDALRGGAPVTLFADEWRTPLDLATAARALVALAGASPAGIVHLGGPERLSRLEMGRTLARVLGLDEGGSLGGRGILARLRADVPAPEPRPADVSLESGRWRGLFPEVPWPTFEDAVRAWLGGTEIPA